MTGQSVERIAEVVLYEGYLLYPYTRSTLKNQQRWNFGGVYPLDIGEEERETDPWRMQTQCLVTGGAGARVSVKLRFLQVVDRTVRDVNGTIVESLRVGDFVHLPIDEAAERSVIVESSGGDEWLLLDELVRESREVPIDVPAGRSEEVLTHADGTLAGTLVREWQSLHGLVTVRADAEEDGLYRLTVVTSNHTETSQCAALPRHDILRYTFVSTHTILHVENGNFISLLEPPPEYAEAASTCTNVGTWPVLVGEPGEQHTVLSSPIILYDYPQIAPESHGDFFDTTEIDELLTLSVLALTDEEKQEMRETDLRAREILDRTEALSSEQVLKLHGAIRGLETVRGSRHE